VAHEKAIAMASEEPVKFGQVEIELAATKKTSSVAIDVKVAEDIEHTKDPNEGEDKESLVSVREVLLCTSIVILCT
jgi:hypothetical protein